MKIYDPKVKRGLQLGIEINILSAKISKKIQVSELSSSHYADLAVPFRFYQSNLIFSFFSLLFFFVSGCILIGKVF